MKKNNQEIKLSEISNISIQKTIYAELEIIDLKLLKCILSNINCKDTKIDESCTVYYNDMDNVGIGKLHRFTQVNKSLKKLSSCYVKIKINDDEIELGLIKNKFIYKKNSSKIIVEIDTDLQPYLLDLKKQYTRYELHNIKEFDSVYTLQMYELMKSWLAKERYSTTLKNLRAYLNIQENRYKLYGSFKQKILKRSIEIINATTDISVVFKEEKRGREVYKIHFHIIEKEIQEDEENIDITKLIDKVFIDNKSTKYLIISYEQNAENKKLFRYKVFAIREKKISYTDYLLKNILYSRVSKMVKETEMSKKIGLF